MNNLRTSRKSFGDAIMTAAFALSEMSTCARRAVGCIILDSSGKVLATGYNGTPSGQNHCIDINCKGARSLSGTDLDLCRAVHAEANAIMQCADVKDIYEIFCTTQPCVHCAKMIANTACRYVVFSEPYNTHFEEVLDILTASNIKLYNLKDYNER